jgi:hypothetical protein
VSATKLWHHDDFLFEEQMKKLSESEMLKLAKRIAKHAPPVHLTTEQLGEAMIRTANQMTPIEKAKLRRTLRGINRTVLTKTAKRLQRCKDVLIGMKCDPRVN